MFVVHKERMDKYIRRISNLVLSKIDNKLIRACLKQYIGNRKPMIHPYKVPEKSLNKLFSINNTI